jgi:hypothetical protein
VQHELNIYTILYPTCTSHYSHTQPPQSETAVAAAVQAERAAGAERSAAAHLQGIEVGESRAMSALTSQLAAAEAAAGAAAVAAEQRVAAAKAAVAAAVAAKRREWDSECAQALRAAESAAATTRANAVKLEVLCSCFR